MSEGVPLRSLVTTVFLPSAIFGIGQGAGAPVIALIARDLGASVGTSGFIVALVGLGAVLGDLPAGRMVARFGERRSIIVGSSLGTAGVLLCLIAWNPLVLGIGVLLTGFSSAVWGLARQSYLAEAVGVARRARAMAMFAMTWRLGYFVGPLIGAAVILAVGTHGGFLVQLVGIVVSGYLMARLADPPRAEGAVPGGARLAEIVRTHRAVLGTLGLGALMMGAARSSRDAVLPLWADHLGLSAATASVVFGIGALADLLCSYPAGMVMDRYGRRAMAVPSLLVIGVSLFALPFAAGVIGMTAVAVLMGVGNGLGNGVIMTLGADVAPTATRAEFLAAWRLMHDSGMFLGPLAVGGVAVVAPLGVAAAALGVVACAGAATMHRFIPAWRPT